MSGFAMLKRLSFDIPRSHMEGPSTALGTALNYAAIRVLGMRADHPVAVKARQVLHKLGNVKTMYSEYSN